MQRLLRVILLQLTCLHLVVSGGGGAGSDRSADPMSFMMSRASYGKVTEDFSDGWEDDLSSSTFETARLLREEVKFSRDLFKYRDALAAQLSEVDKVLSAVYPDGPVAEPEDAESHVANPLNGFGLVRRLGHLLDFSATRAGMRELGDLSERLVNATRIFPSPSSYADGISGVSLLQDSYSLNITALAEGEIRVGGKVFKSEYRPGWREMVALAEASCQQGWMDTCITWFETALASVDPDDDISSEDRAQLAEAEKNLESAKKVHDQLLDKRGPVSDKHRCNAVPYDKKLAKKKKYKKARKTPGTATQKVYNTVPLFRAYKHHKMFHDNFQLLCSGKEEGGAHELGRPPSKDAILRCYNLNHGRAYLKLAPFKLEEKSDEPFVAVIHGFLSPGEMKYLRDYTVGRMHRSRTGHNSDERKSLIRTSKQTWFSEKWFTFHMSNETESALDPPPIPFDPMRYFEVTDQVGARVSRRIEDATGLSVLGVFSAENYQIANYGLGGQYSTHHDAGNFFGLDPSQRAALPFSQLKHNVAVGDRFVTVMGYLSDIGYGGSTVFPAIGVKSEVEAGAVVIWFNLMRDGRSDRLTYHGGCPVVVGSKWITNKWIFYNDQFKNYPCGLKFGERALPLNSWRNGI